MTTYFEDLAVGWSETYGEHQMEQDAMIAFAEQFDPQPMHTDPDAAAETVHGDVIASGLHTIGVATRLLVENFLNDTSNVGGLGLDEVRYHEPVYPGDRLSVRHEVVSKRRSASNPGTGIVTRDVEVLSEDGPVCSWTATLLMETRD